MNEVGLSIVLPALAAGLLVAATHVPLGIQVLARGIVFIDIAIAQIAGVGVMLADFLGYEPEGMAVQVWALWTRWGAASAASPIKKVESVRSPPARRATVSKASPYGPEET